MKFMVCAALVLGALGFALVGCASAPAGDVSVVIDHQNKAYGKPVPDWITRAPGETEALPVFSGKVVFRAQFQAEDLMSARQIARGYDIKQEVVSSITETVTARSKTASDTVSGTTSARVLQTIESEAKAYSMPPLKEYDTFWELRQVGSAKPLYTYYILYVVDKLQMDEATQAVLRKSKDSLSDDPAAQTWFDEAYGPTTN